MFTFLIEFLSLVLFVGCYWHAARYEGRAFAQRWFVAAFLYVFIRDTIVQVVLQTFAYAPAVLRIGVAPALVGLLWGAVFYLAFQFARRFVAAENRAAVLALLFVIAASIALPIEAAAARLQWWLYPDAKRTVFGAMPVIAPLLWGGGAVIFYAVFARVNASRLSDRGRFYALVTLSPVIAIAHLLYALFIGFFG
jgi:hypothetical protein